MGELHAVRFLKAHGNRVVDRNIFVNRDEIDIVYAGSSGLVAVEVKTTRGDRDPFDAIDGEKIRRVRRAIAGYHRPIGRIDAIGVRLTHWCLETRWLQGIG